MSLKRKVPTSAEISTQKKPKVDFFAPRKAAKAEEILFKFDPKANGSITRLTTWNVNGIKSVDKKILEKYLTAEDPDILILTETKCSDTKPDILCLKRHFKYHYWGIDPKPGNAGCAILSKIKPLDVIVGLPTWPDTVAETFGRYVQVEFDHVYLLGTYVFNSGENFKAMDKKQKWNQAFTQHTRELDSKKPIIWAGDFNCIPTKKDVDSKAAKFWDRMSGMSETERTEFDVQLNPTDEKSSKFMDAWRHLHPDTQEYTHASEKFGAWRLDSFIVSERILQDVSHCVIRNDLKNLKLSDHWPVTLDFAGLILDSKIAEPPA